MNTEKNPLFIRIGFSVVPVFAQIDKNEVASAVQPRFTTSGCYPPNIQLCQRAFVLRAVLKSVSFMEINLCVTGISTGSDFHDKHTAAKNKAIPVYQLRPT